MKRREFLEYASLFGAMTLIGCGGGSDGPSEAPAAPVAGSGEGGVTSPTPPPAPPPTGGSPAPAPAPAPAPSGPPTAGLSTLTLIASSNVTGPYLATAMPLEGLVPAGQTLDSPDDPTLRASVISRWPDGSASVVVLAGSTALGANSAKQVRLRATPAGASAALTPARVAQLISSLTVDCGSAGSGSVTNLASPQRVWWANERVICCRYRVAVGSLEAQVDVHAFDTDRALVEVVVENGRVNLATSAPATPSGVSGYNATLRVNGNSVAMSTGGRSHGALRAWYGATWVGGDPGIEVTHDTASLQAHPLLFKLDRGASVSMSGYASDAYSPWSTGRQRATGMGAGGDHDSIGPLPRWETQYLQTGDRNARRAVIASALAVLSYNVNYREAGSGAVPNFDQLMGFSQQSGSSKRLPSEGSEPAWEVAHHPAAGLMAFICRPSPCFIEIAQKIAVWNGTWSSSDGTFEYWYQTRGKAWGMRSLAHAIFLTPDNDAWKNPARAALTRNVQLLSGFKNSAWGRLNFVWDYAPDSANNAESGASGFYTKMWQHQYLTTEVHKAARAKLLAGSQQDALVALADWCALQPVRYVNESVGGEFRAQCYHTRSGENGTTINSLATWGQQLAAQYGSPPPLNGPWLSGGGTESSYGALGTESTAGAFYASYFWAALVAAVERGVPGADAAWARVQSAVTNLGTWRAGFGADPRWGAAPRNK